MTLMFSNNHNITYNRRGCWNWFGNSWLLSTPLCRGVWPGVVGELSPVHPPLISPTMFYPLPGGIEGGVDKLELEMIEG